LLSDTVVMVAVFSLLPVDVTAMPDGQKNTAIVAPGNNTAVSGMVAVEVEARACNCTATTALSVDGVFISNGTRQSMVQRGDLWYEVFIHQWDSRTVSDGSHQVKVLGKHTEYSDVVTVYVGNSEDDGALPGFSLAVLAGAFGVVAAVYARKRSR